MNLQEFADVKKSLSPMEAQYAELFQKIAMEAVSTPEGIDKLINSHPDGMLNYTVEDLGYVMERLCGTANDEQVKNEILELPLIKDHLMEDKFKDNIERCRGLYFLLIYLENLKHEDCEGNKFHALYVANGVNSAKDLLLKAASSGEITFFSFLKDADTEHNLEMPNLDLLDPDKWEAQLNTNPLAKQFNSAGI